MNNQLQNAIKDVKKGLKRFDLFELILKRFVSRRTVKVWTFDVMEIHLLFAWYLQKVQVMVIVSSIVS